MLSLFEMNAKLLSYFTPSVVAVLVKSIGVLLSIIVVCYLYSLVRGVIRVSLDFELETFILFERCHCYRMLM